MFPVTILSLAFIGFIFYLVFQGIRNQNIKRTRI